MNKTLLFLGLALASTSLFAAPACAEYIQGIDIHDYCNSDTSSETGRLYRMQLLGYIQGALDQIEMTGRLCIPTGIKTGEVATNICSYLTSHPELLNQGGRTLMWASATSLYPCKTPTIPENPK